MQNVRLVKTSAYLIPWQVHSLIQNENAQFRDLGIKLDHYLAGFMTEERARIYCHRQNYKIISVTE